MISRTSCILSREDRCGAPPSVASTESVRIPHLLGLQRLRGPATPKRGLSRYMAALTWRPSSGRLAALDNRYMLPTPPHCGGRYMAALFGPPRCARQSVHAPHAAALRRPLYGSPVRAASLRSTIGTCSPRRR